MSIPKAYRHETARDIKAAISLNMKEILGKLNNLSNLDNFAERFFKILKKNNL